MIDDEELDESVAVAIPIRYTEGEGDKEVDRDSLNRYMALMTAAVEGRAFLTRTSYKGATRTVLCMETKDGMVAPMGIILTNEDMPDLENPLRAESKLN